jgi:hypothetical protein
MPQQYRMRASSPPADVYDDHADILVAYLAACRSASIQPRCANRSRRPHTFNLCPRSPATALGAEQQQVVGLQLHLKRYQIVASGPSPHQR